MKSTLFSLPNLSSGNITPVKPWEIKDWPEFPKSKDAFKDWVSLSTTEGHFVSAYEGINPHGRVNKTNAPWKMHGLIADYDAIITREEITDGLGRRTRTGFKPMFAHRTVSGNCRVIWMFEEPISLLPGVMKEFLGLLIKETNAKNLFPGLDDNIQRPEQYYCWMPPAITFSETPIKVNAIHNLLGIAVERARKYRGEGDAAIPLDKVFERLQATYPGKWMGPFEVGARGPAFWSPEATANSNPTAAIVTETGMVAFSQERSFYNWADLFGSNWVREFQEDQYGGAISSFWFDGKYYWRRDLEGKWRSTESGVAKQDIIGSFGLSGAPDLRGTLSQADEAMRRIRDSRIIDAPVPCLYDPREVLIQNGRRVLNISRLRIVQPAEGSHAWGENFPWIANFLDRALDPHDSLTYLMAWLKRFYCSALEGRLVPGQAVFIAGPVGKGKTLFGSRIVASLMGGGSDASDYLVNGSSFNAELFEVAVWNVDDSSSANSLEAHKKFSQMIKKGVANTRHAYHRKFHDAQTVDWMGRIIDTLNDDPESIQAIPHTDGSILDKISLYKFKDHGIEFPSHADLEATLNKEMPHFAAWLVSWNAPQETKGSERYGVKSYHHPILLQESRSSSGSHEFSEFLDLYLKQYAKDHTDEVEWSGTATELLLGFQNDASLRDSVKMFIHGARALGRMLANLSSTDERLKRKIVRGTTIWKISLAREEY
jgi:hypothetical protein